MAMVLKLLPLLALLSCTTVNQNLDPNTFYKRDVYINVNGQAFSGVGVARHAAKYQIEVKSLGKMDMFTLTTCHREVTQENVKASGGWFRKKENKISVNYTPAKGIEDTGACPVNIGVYEKNKGRHSWGFIDFGTSDATLPGYTSCNGRYISWGGVSVCQSRIGLMQSITFDKPVIVEPTDGCKIDGNVQDKTFLYETNKGLCVYAFVEIDKPHRVHRHSVLGYEKIIIRN